MYEAYWNLNRRPFDDGAAPEFYYPSSTHQAGLLKLRYLLEQDKGIALIAGEHGLGKTYLTHVLEREAKEQGTGSFIRLVIPALSPNETLAYFANRLGAKSAASAGSEAILLSLEDRLRSLSEAKQSPVFVIDDAHLLEMDHLNAIRLLLNLREDGVGKFSILLVGRTDLLAKVQRHKSLDQRIAVRMALKPLSVDDVHRYLQCRLAAAGVESSVFDVDTAETIWQLSQGVPRRINQIADLALLVGFVDHLRSVSPIEVRAAAEELHCVRS